MLPGDQANQQPDAARNLNGEDLTQAALASFDQSASPRFRQLAQSLVRHLHDFVRETGLTEAEWAAGIDFLTRVGHITTEQRQEFILLSDVLGVSMQVIGVNHPTTGAATESTVFGPFFVHDSPLYACGDDLANGAPGEPCYLAGQVRSTTGAPVAGARIEVWQADEVGRYDVQYADLPAARGRGYLFADAEGRYHFWSVLPAAYPIPDDGPVGELLAAARRSPMRPAHVHFMVTAPGYQSLITHVFAEGDRYLDSDAVFGVKSSLIAPFTRHEPGVAPDGKRLSVPYYTMNYDFILPPQTSPAG